MYNPQVQASLNVLLWCKMCKVATFTTTIIIKRNSE